MSSKATGPSPASVPSSQWDLENVFRQGKNFKNIRRVSALSSKEEVESVIKEHDESGEPLIIEGFHELKSWPHEVFSIDWLLQHYVKQSVHLYYTFHLHLLIPTRVLCPRREQA